jgi:hypothetical protein
MKWRRQTDYHGSRTYAERSDEPAWSKVRFDLALLAGWARQQLEKLMRAGAPRPDEVRTLADATETNISGLGAAYENRREIAHSIWAPLPGRTKERTGSAFARPRNVEAGSQPRL